MAIIFRISAMTSEDLAGFPHVWDKLAHTCEYACLAGCFALWWERSKWASRQWLRVLIVAIAALVYGCTDEYHQAFVDGRSSDPMDLIADFTGGVIGGTVYALICLLLNRFDPLPVKEKTSEESDVEENEQ